MPQYLSKWPGRLTIPRSVRDFRDRKIQTAYRNALCHSTNSIIDGQCRGWILECLASGYRNTSQIFNRAHFEPAIARKWHGEIGLMPCTIPRKASRSAITYKIVPGHDNDVIMSNEIKETINARVLWNSDTGFHDYQWIQCVQKDYWLMRHGSGKKGPVAFENAIIVRGYQDSGEYSKLAFNYHFQDIDQAIEAFINLCKTT